MATQRRTLSVVVYTEFVRRTRYKTCQYKNKLQLGRGGGHMVFDSISSGVMEYSTNGMKSKQEGMSVVRKTRCIPDCMYVYIFVREQNNSLE
jgi:hypothetical protein